MGVTHQMHRAFIECFVRSISKMVGPTIVRRTFHSSFSQLFLILVSVADDEPGCLYLGFLVGLLVSPDGRPSSKPS